MASRCQQKIEKLGGGDRIFHPLTPPRTGEFWVSHRMNKGESACAVTRVDLSGAAGVGEGLKRGMHLRRVAVREPRGI